jgi:hypothetical protein
MAKSNLQPGGLIPGAGIPKGKRTNQFVECGCCGAYHRLDFLGDCRENTERYYFDTLPADAVIVEDEDDDVIIDESGEY